MINIKDLEKEFNKINTFTRYDKSLVYNSNLVYRDGSNESFCYSVSQVEKGYMITDISFTYNKLLKEDVDLLEDEDVIEYRNRVLNLFNVGLGESNELYIIVKSLQEIPLALGNLSQAMTLLTYIPLQFE